MTHLGFNPKPLGSRLPAHLLKNYVILAPASTHWRPSTCAEVKCHKFMHGWDTVADESTELGRNQAAYIRGQLRAPDGAKCGRRYQEIREPGSTLTTFRFERFQKPFGAEHDEHRVRVEREEIFAVRDPEVNNGQLYLHDGREHGAVNWVDDFATHQDRLATAKDQG